MLVNHIGDIHVAAKARTPLFVKPAEKLSGGISSLDGLCGHLTGDLAGVDGKANALAHQRRAMPASISGQQQAIAREALHWPLRGKKAGMILKRAGILKLA